MINKLEPDVVHIQHEYGLYDIDDKFSTDLLDLLVQLNLQKMRPSSPIIRFTALSATKNAYL